MLENTLKHHLITIVVVATALVCPSYSAWAYSAQLQLALPGQVVTKRGEQRKETVAGWYALSLQDGELVVASANRLTPADQIMALGSQAEKILQGLPSKSISIPTGLSLRSSAEALLYFRLEEESGSPRKFLEGRFPSAIKTATLEEGWSSNFELGAKSGENPSTNKWRLFTDHKKRADGRMLAGSLTLIAQKESSHATDNAKKTLLPKAIGMAFAKQELLWLGDLNQDGVPDLLVRRTWITGEIDYVLVLTPLLANAYLDRDYPVNHFTSGVEPEGNVLTWYKDASISPQQIPGKIVLTNRSSFRIGEETWKNKLKDADLNLPKLLTDSVLKLNGETVRVTLEHLPRVESNPNPESNAMEPSSQSNANNWDGSVLLRVTFRGKSQVLMQLQAPDGDDFIFTIGVSEGKPSIKVDYHPHYNNGFQRYWIYDDKEMRFRRVFTDHSQGC